MERHRSNLSHCHCAQHTYPLPCPYARVDTRATALPRIHEIMSVDYAMILVARIAQSVKYFLTLYLQLLPCLPLPLPSRPVPPSPPLGLWWLAMIGSRNLMMLGLLPRPGSNFAVTSCCAAAAPHLPSPSIFDRTCTLGSHWHGSPLFCSNF